MATGNCAICGEHSDKLYGCDNCDQMVCPDCSTFSSFQSNGIGDTDQCADCMGWGDQARLSYTSFKTAQDAGGGGGDGGGGDGGASAGGDGGASAAGPSCGNTGDSCACGGAHTETGCTSCGCRGFLGYGRPWGYSHPGSLPEHHKKKKKKHKAQVTLPTQDEAEESHCAYDDGRPAVTDFLGKKVCPDHLRYALADAPKTLAEAEKGIDTSAGIDRLKYENAVQKIKGDIDKGQKTLAALDRKKNLEQSGLSLGKKQETSVMEKEASLQGVECPDCDGDGQCSNCGGDGYGCSECEGTGNCPQCYGEGYETDDEWSPEQYLAKVAQYAEPDKCEYCDGHGCTQCFGTGLTTVPTQEEQRNDMHGVPLNSRTREYDVKYDTPYTTTSCIRCGTKVASSDISGVNSCENCAPVVGENLDIYTSSHREEIIAKLYDEDPEGWAKIAQNLGCPNCDGTGSMPDGTVCHACFGTGHGGGMMIHPSSKQSYHESGMDETYRKIHDEQKTAQVKSQEGMVGILYGDDGETYKSTDGGATWDKMGEITAGGFEKREMDYLKDKLNPTKHKFANEENPWGTCKDCGQAWDSNQHLASGEHNQEEDDEDDDIKLFRFDHGPGQGNETAHSEIHEQEHTGSKELNPHPSATTSEKNDAKMEACVDKVIAKGNKKSSAIAICKDSLGFTKEEAIKAIKKVREARRARSLGKEAATLMDSYLEQADTDNESDTGLSGFYRQRLKSQDRRQHQDIKRDSIPPEAVHPEPVDYNSKYPRMTAAVDNELMKDPFELSDDELMLDPFEAAPKKKPKNPEVEKRDKKIKRGVEVAGEALDLIDKVIKAGSENPAATGSGGHAGTTVDDLTDNVGSGEHPVPVVLITDHMAQLRHGTNPGVCECGQPMEMHAQFNPTHEEGQRFAQWDYRGPSRPMTPREMFGVGDFAVPEREDRCKSCGTWLSPVTKAMDDAPYCTDCIRDGSNTRPKRGE